MTGKPQKQKGEIFDKSLCSSGTTSILTEETKINLYQSDGKRRMWRKEGSEAEHHLIL